MALGDVKSAIASVVATTGTYDIKPPVGEEWVLHNIYYNGGTVEFYRTDGVNSLRFDSDTTQGARMGIAYHVSNTQWLQIKNTSASAILVGYDGVQTK
jgi:hypothetical protein